MDLDDLLGARRGQRRQGHCPSKITYRNGDRHSRHHNTPGSHRPSLAREMWRAAFSRPWLVGAAAGLLVVLLTAALWGVMLLLGHVEEHGLKGLIQAVLAIGARLWQGR